jgi:hypothetical protein
MNANYVGYAAAVIWITLPVVYMVTAPDWRKSRTGRALMWLLGSTAGLFLLLITGGIFGDYPFKEWVRAAVFAAVLYAGIRLSVLFVHLRIEVERRIREERK